eukprot:3574300-Pyramimonas_sp.AAC.1
MEELAQAAARQKRGVPAADAPAAPVVAPPCGRELRVWPQEALAHKEGGHRVVVRSRAHVAVLHCTRPFRLDVSSVYCKTCAKQSRMRRWR